MDLKPVDVSGLNLEVEGERVSQIKVPSGYVPYTFMPNLEMHHVWGGEKLREGMVVVIAEAIGRGNPSILEPEYREKNDLVISSYDRESLSRTSRWAIVTDLKKTGRIITFNALYADGSTVPRSYSVDWRWAVLKEMKVSVFCSNCGLDHNKDPEIDEFVKALKTVTDDALKSMMGLDLPNGLFHFDLPKGLPWDPNFFLPPYSPNDPLFDSSFVNRFLGLGRNSNTENSAEGQVDEKPPVSPTNFERRLRDADSRSKVRKILIERDDFFGKRLEEKTLEDNNPEHMLSIPASQLVLDDVFFLAGSTYKVIGLSNATVNETEEEVWVDLLKIGTTWEKSITFNRNEKIEVAQRS